MGDMYGISNSVMEANSLHGQIALEREQRQSDYAAKLTAFNQGIKDARGKDTSTNEGDIAGNVSDVQKVYNVGSGIYGGVTGAASAGTKAAALGFGGVSGATATLGAGAKGFAKGFDAAGGASKGFSALKSVAGGGEGLTGMEGIVQKGLVKVGGGEALGLVGGKAAGAVGGLVDAGKQIDSLIDSDGKSMFMRTNAQGKEVEDSTTDKWGEGLTEVGSAMDVVSTFTGGLLAPLAAAVSLAGAVTEAVGSVEDEKADNLKNQRWQEHQFPKHSQV